MTAPGRSLRFSFHDHDVALPLGDLYATAPADTYRDTPARDLEAIVAEVTAGRRWRESVAARYAATNPWLHRIVTDPSRDLFFREYPPPAGARILDIGAGWGQLALPLARRGLVCALEPTPERLAFVRAAARQEGVHERLWYIQADYGDVRFTDLFDLVCCIGVLEWVPKFSAIADPLEAQQQFLAKIRRELAPGGKLVLGIENRLGLKYLLGAADDHTSETGLHVYDRQLAAAKWRERQPGDLRVLTHTRAELDELLDAAGFSRRHFYGAFPDYKLPQQILPWGAAIDQFLGGSFIPEHAGHDGAPLANQAELRSHYRSLAQLGIASDFAPSFFVVAS